MDLELYERVLSAVEQAHGGTTTSQERSVAFYTLEGFKDREDGVEYALYILTTPSPRHTDQVRHFALHCLESVMARRWKPQAPPAANSASKGKGGSGAVGGAGGSSNGGGGGSGQEGGLSEAQQERLKTAMLEIMLQGTRDLRQEAQFIKIKVADLVAQVAERLFPERWEDLLDKILQAWTTGPTQAELALLVLSKLIEDCMDGDFNSKLDSGRRDVILAALNEFLPRLLPTLYNFLLQEWNQCKTAAPQTVSQSQDSVQSNPTATELQVHSTLLNHALVLLSKLLPWVPEDLIHSPAHDFLPAMMELSYIRASRVEALRCLVEACSVKALSCDRFLRLLENIAPAVKRVMESLSVETVSIDGSLEVYALVSSCLQSVLKLNMGHLATEEGFKDRNSPKSAMLLNHLEQLLVLCGLPSKYIAWEALTMWHTLAGKTYAKDIPALVVLAPRLLSVYTGQLIKVRFEDGVAEDPVAAEEFVDKSEYEAFIHVFKSQVSAIEPLLSNLNPLHTVQLVWVQLEGLLLNHTVARDHLDASGMPTRKSQAYSLWRTFAEFTKRAVMGLPDWCFGEKPPEPSKAMEGGTQGEVGEQCRQLLSQILNAVLNWQPNGHLLIGCQLTVIEGCKELLPFNPTLPQLVFEKVFAYIETPHPLKQNPIEPNNPEVESVWRNASHAAVALAGVVSDQLVAALGGLSDRVRNILTNNKPEEGVRTNLLEVLLVVSNAVQDQDQRRAFVLDILQQPVQSWNSPEVSAMLQSPQVLLARLGVTPDLPTNPVAASAILGPSSPASLQAVSSFQTLRHPLKMLLGLGTRVAAVPGKRRDDMDAMLGAGIEGLVEENSFVRAWQHVLPNVISLVRCLQLIYCLPTRTMVLSHPVARYFLGIVPHKEGLTSGNAFPHRMKPADFELSTQDMFQIPLVWQWPRMAHELRSLCYDLLGLSCRQGALYMLVPSERVSDVIMGSILSGLDYMDNRNIPGFFKRFVEPYLLFCPPSLVMSHAKPVLEAITGNMIPRLSAAWSPQSEGAQRIDRELFQIYADGGVLLGEEELDEEALADMRMRHRQTFTSSFADLLSVCLGISGELHASVHAQGGSSKSKGKATSKGKDRSKGKPSQRGSGSIEHAEEVQDHCASVFL